VNALRRLLTELAEAGRTGALHLEDARRGGVIYLVAGRITHAESAACPGIGERLVSSGRLSAAAWQHAYATGRAGRAVGRILVRDGLLGHHELACRVVAAIAAATHALLQVDDDAPMRFVPGERHWFGTAAGVERGGPGAAAQRALSRPARLSSRPAPLFSQPARRTRSRTSPTR
jgi:hypothetical protein